MAAKGQLTGMLGVYLSAAELTHQGFIVSPTSRSALGADLLVTDQKCQNAWSIQVKTNRQAANFWLLNPHAAEIKSETHIYIFVNLKKKERPDYLVIPSKIVAEKVYTEKSKTGSVWYSFAQNDGKEFVTSKGWQEGWEIFSQSTAEPSKSK